MRRLMTILAAVISSGCYMAHEPEVETDDGPVPCMHRDDCPEVCDVPDSPEWRDWRVRWDCAPHVDAS